MADHRDAVIQEWTSWLDARVASAGRMPPGTIERELRLLYNIMTESVGPLRRSVNEVWHHAAEHYGRFGAARGLAAGEIVEEGRQQGRAMVDEARGKGAQVVVADFNEELGRETVRLIEAAGGTAVFSLGDVSKEDSVKAMVDFALATPA